MARFTLILLTLLPWWQLHAESSEDVDTPPEQDAAGPPAHQDLPHDFERRKRMWEKLTPEQREQLRQNFERWKKLPSAKKRMLRERSRMREERIEKDIEAAYKQTELQLTPDQREVFSLRYRQERRKIEEKLRQEMEEKRKPLIQQMIRELKQEFSAAASPSPAPE
jgi:hypothetical protein